MINIIQPYKLYSYSVDTNIFSGNITVAPKFFWLCNVRTYTKWLER